MRLARSEQPTTARSEAAARRLALLAADLSGDIATERPVRPAPEPVEPLDAEPEWWEDHTRVAAAPAPPAQPDSEPLSSAPDFPIPGRHAVRRRPAPEPGRGASLRPMLRAWSPAHLTVIAVLVAVGLAVTAWWVARDRPTAAPTPIAAAPALVPTGPAGSAGGAPDTSTAPTSAAEVTVDVAGKVKRPGIVVLAAGARVVDAVEAAGGARPGVDLSGINLARVLVDGEQILVGRPGTGGAVPTVPSASGSPGTSLVNLNLATAEQLEELPEVGPVTAAAIVTWRDEHGGFTSVDDLLEVDGIGPATLEQIRPYATV